MQNLIIGVIQFMAVLNFLRKRGSDITPGDSHSNCKCNDSGANSTMTTPRLSVWTPPYCTEHPAERVLIVFVHFKLNIHSLQVRPFYK